MDEDKWVTMKGTHVLVDDKGEIKNEKLRKAIGSKGKSSGSKKEDKKEEKKEDTSKKQDEPKKYKKYEGAKSIAHMVDRNDEKLADNLVKKLSRTDPDDFVDMRETVYKCLSDSGLDDEVASRVAPTLDLQYMRDIAREYRNTGRPTLGFLSEFLRGEFD